ncbi:hypothetical protein [Microbulbifer sp. MCCC 1A16149]|uniref:hypothetical protein n=1 Tax=Microbulbifer sp. MCCC 1A16149 TaxID=3411322 RepID=UPI003D138A65
MSAATSLPEWHLLSPDEQAAAAGVARRTIDHWAATDPKLNEIAPPIKIGKRKKARRSDQFLEYLQQR